MISRRHLIVAAAALPLTAAGTAPVKLTMVTELGPIVIEVYPDKAPITAGNFLAYADGHLLDNGVFYRTVTQKNDNNPVTINVIQGGGTRKPLPPIAHETTATTGILHTDGVVSMARGEPGTAASDFFICVGDNPELDFGGKRTADGLGFAAFGRVVEGMDLVRTIHDSATNEAGAGYTKGQMLTNPIIIQKLSRN